MIAFTLPYPPTANNLFMNVGKRRIRTKAYDAWIAEASYWIHIQNAPVVGGPYTLAIIAHRPDRRARDIDNLIKPISDVLTKTSVISDDSRAEKVSAEWSKLLPAKGATVYVTVEPADA